MTTKKWISTAIVAVTVLLSLLLIKIMPFWATLACIVSLALGFVAGYLFKNPIENIIEMVDTTEVIDKIKEWFASLTTSDAMKGVSAARKELSK